jgi:hypothetical protein
LIACSCWLSITLLLYDSYPLKLWKFEASLATSSDLAR